MLEADCFNRKEEETEPNHDAFKKRRPNRIEPEKIIAKPNRTETMIFRKLRNRNESNQTGSFLIQAPPTSLTPGAAEAPRQLALGPARWAFPRPRGGEGAMKSAVDVCCGETSTANSKCVLFTTEGPREITVGARNLAKTHPQTPQSVNVGLWRNLSSMVSAGSPSALTTTTCVALWLLH